jgi:hypothetical protein
VLPPSQAGGGGRFVVETILCASIALRPRFVGSFKGRLRLAFASARFLVVGVGLLEPLLRRKPVAAQRAVTVDVVFGAYPLSRCEGQVSGWLHRMTSRYIEAWGDPMIAHTAALKKLWETAYRKAQVQAFADAYLVIADCFGISAMMVPLMRGVTPK